MKVGIVGDCSDWTLGGIRDRKLDPKTARLVQSCDVFVFNLEGPIIGRGIVPSSPYPPAVTPLLRLIGKRQPLVTSTDAVLTTLRLARRNVACLANNHILDAGPEGLRNTITILRANGFDHLGAGENLADASRPLVIERTGKRLGILNYNFVGFRKFGLFINVFGARASKAGANYSAARLIDEEIRKTRAEADFVLGMIHFGRVRSRALSRREEALLTRLDFDLITIAHSHSAQRTSGKIVSCGDFLMRTDGGVAGRGRLVILTLDDDGASHIEEHKLLLEKGFPRVTQAAVGT